MARRSKSPARSSGTRLVTFYHDVMSEMKKVTWPDRAQLQQATIQIIIFVLVIGAVIALLDVALQARARAAARHADRPLTRRSMLEHRWYAIQTTSGHENKVQRLIQRKIDMDAAAPEDRLIRQALVPVQEVVEIKNGKKVNVERKIFPGYVLVDMVASQDTLHEINAIQGVIKFVGKDKDPMPLRDDEVRRLLGVAMRATKRRPRKKFRSSSDRRWRSRKARSPISTARSRK